MVRRLATILAADVVGYSRLMENDEAGTLASLKAHRAEFIDPLISEYGGRIVKLVGDGTLAEVASVVDALDRVVVSQPAMSKRNARTPPEHAQLQAPTKAPTSDNASSPPTCEAR